MPESKPGQSGGQTGQEQGQKPKQQELLPVVSLQFLRQAGLVTDLDIAAVKSLDHSKFETPKQG